MPSSTSQINLVSAARASAVLPQLTALLQDCVGDGASIGFLPPLAMAEAEAYWREIFSEINAGTRVMLVAQNGESIVGAVQLGLATKPNATHRAEVQKLLVLSSARRHGLGRALMQAIELEAQQRGRTLLVLDTRLGDSAEKLYAAMGYIRSGEIPFFAQSADGTLHTTVVFYKRL